MWPDAPSRKKKSVSSSVESAKHPAAAAADSDATERGEDVAAADEDSLFDALLLALRASRDGAASEEHADHDRSVSHESAMQMLHDMRGDDPMFLRLKEALLAETF